MTKEEVEAVLAHEVAHISNGDMVTMTLIQGVLNTFVVFAARVIGYVVNSAMRKGSDSSGVGAGQIMGRNQPMIQALQRLSGLRSGDLPKGVAALGIAGGLGKLFSTHPPMEERIAALQAR
jgi:heat shock protein HtpX